MEALRDRNAANEFGLGAGRGFDAVDGNVGCLRIYAGLGEDVFQADASPLGVADGAFVPLEAGHHGAVVGAAVAGAFEDGDELDLFQAFEVGEFEGEGFRDETFDFEFEGGGVGRWGVGVGADEEGIVGGEVGFESGELHFVIFGAGGLDFQVAARSGGAGAGEQEGG